MLQNALLEHSAILSTFIKLPFVFRTFVLSIFEWPLKTGFSVVNIFCFQCYKLWDLDVRGFHKVCIHLNLKYNSWPNKHTVRINFQIVKPVFGNSVVPDQLASADLHSFSSTL